MGFGARQTYAKLSPSGYENWADNDLNMGDHRACANEPPAIEYGCVEEASGTVETPATMTHPPDPTHLSMPESSPHTKDNVNVEGLTQQEGYCQSLTVILSTTWRKQCFNIIRRRQKLYGDQCRKNWCPPHPKKEHQWTSVDTPISGQSDLDKDVFDPLKTPTDMPMQDKSITPIQEDISDDPTQFNVVTEAKDHMLDETDDNMSVVSSFQERQ